MGTLAVRPADALSGAQLAQVQVIYEESFSPGMRVPFSELTCPGEDDLMLVAMDGVVPAGLAVLRLLGSVGWSFLRYFAIAGQRRSQGAGRRFWQLLHARLGEEGWSACVILEVEDPADAAGDEPERVIRQRRVSFWAACGARVLPVPGYVLPDFTAGGMTEPMLLMAATPAAAPPVHGDQLRMLVTAIYTGRYGLAPDDPLVTGAVASVTA